jgi:hypothetical protein
MSGPYNSQPDSQPGEQPPWGGYPGGASYPQHGQPGYGAHEGYQQGGYSYPQQAWGTPRRETVGVIGLIGAAAGAALLIVSFTALAWYRIVGQDVKFSDCHRSLNQPGAPGFPKAYFGWLGWVLLALNNYRDNATNALGGVGVFKHSAVGLYFALIGFLTAGVAGVFGPRRG